MRVPITWSGLAIAAAIGCGVATAQQPQVPLPPSTVQLPTFSFFTVQTTVSVPDRGAMQLGGITRGRDSRIERGFGPLANRATGSERSVASTSVHATIIDNDEIDRMLLAAAARRTGTAVDPALGKAAELARHVATAAPSLPERGPALAGSVAAIKAQKAAAADVKNSEAAELFAKGQAAEAEGKAAVAKVFYQMVVRRDAGQLKQQAAARLAALASGSKSAAMAQR
jgi:hypothetical protein